jgi:hypothetical protein
MHMPSAVYCVAHGMLVQLDVSNCRCIDYLATVYMRCAYTCSILNSLVQVLYEFLGSREEKLYFAYRFHVNIYIHCMKPVNEIGQNFCTIFEKDLSQILYKFGT